MAKLPEPTVEDYKTTLRDQIKDMSVKNAYWHMWGLKTWMPHNMQPKYVEAVKQMFEEYQDNMIDLEILEG